MTKSAKSNAERFIVAYNNIDYSLRAIYGFKRSISYADLIRKAVSLNSVVRKYEDELIDYGRLRNSIVHKTNPNYVIAEPHDEVVDEFEKIAKLISTPPNAYDTIGHKEVVVCESDASVEDILKIMTRTGYHNIPIYKGNALQGVAIGSKIMQSLGYNLINGRDATEFLTNTNVVDIITNNDDDGILYKVADRNLTIEKALNYFYVNRKLALIIITEKGTYLEKPIGVITTADILDMNAVLENY